MHISLDSALGQQRRLNSVGESITQIAPDPAAAYSLRSLTGGDPKVVRVRRGSDNHEQDFTSSEVSSGALLDFVNSQVTAPLDIQALSATGRDGDFLIAKAAYSLRSLGTRQATVTSSGDTAGDTSGKFVCQVRRDSDDALKSFTATEITDGTLLAFTNADYVKYTSDFSAGDNGWGSFDDVTETGNIDGIGGLDDNLRLAIGSATSQHRAFKNSILPVNQKINFSARVFIPSTNSVVDSLGIRDASGSVIIAAGTTPAQDEWVTITASNVTVTNASGQLRIDLQDGGVNNFAGNGSDVVYLREITVTQVTSDGFVKTWYDQSVSDQAGNTATGNHATQTTAANQPKIVSAGALVVDNGIGGLDFDGDDFLTASSVSGLEGSISMFTVSVRDTTGYVVSPSNSSASNRYFGIQEASSTSVADPRNTSSGASVSDSVSGADRLTFAVTTGATSTSVGSNGSAVTTSTTDYGDNFSGSNLDQIAIGVIRTVSITGHFNGRIREILVYSSDQTDNRTAIEANIGEVYSITGIPAYDNTVDGFVETWYDQSGSGNDLTQATAGNQPKIVSAGSLVTGGIQFDGTSSSGQFLKKETFEQGDLTTPNTIFAVAKYDGGSSQARLFDGSTFTERHVMLLDSDEFSYFNGNLVRTGLSSNTDRHVYSLLFNSPNSSFFLDGSARSSDDNTGSQVFGGINIGVNNNETTHFWDGEITELIIYNSNQSANRSAIETNINGHYSIF